MTGKVGKVGLEGISSPITIWRAVPWVFSLLCVALEMGLCYVSTKAELRRTEAKPLLGFTAHSRSPSVGQVGIRLTASLGTWGE